MIFKSFVKSVNKKGTGIIKLPNDKRQLFKQGEIIKITIISDSKNIIFFAKIISGAVGTYVPRKIMKENNLTDHEQKIIFERFKGFPINISSDGRVYLPNKIGKSLKLKEGEIVKLKILVDGLEKIIHHKVKVRTKPKTTEYFIFLPNKLYNKSGLVIDIYKFKTNKIVFKHEFDFRAVLKKFVFAEIEKNKVLVYLGNRKSIIINSEISFNKIAHYLGCFFADGTKRGNDWGICASTFKQANYFKEMHNFVVPDHKIVYNLTITLNENEKNQLKRIIKLWKEKANVSIIENKINYNISESKPMTNRNKFGTLVMKEHRQLTQKYYNELISHLLHIIKKEKNIKLAQNFICGVMEGDGCLNARNRGHIQITSNDKEVKLLEEFLKYSALEFKIHKEKATGKVYVNIGSMTIIENLDKLGNLLFKYYPKRRKILCERLCNTPVAKFLTNKQITSSPWILKRFKEKGILNKKNALTTQGQKIKQSLLELESEIA